MIRCLLRRKKDKKNLKQHHEDIKNVTEKVVQDVVKTYNLASIKEGIPVNRVNRENQKDMEAAREATRDAREAREATREAREATREARKACEKREAQVDKMLREEDRVEERVTIIRAEAV